MQSGSRAVRQSGSHVATRSAMGPLREEVGPVIVVAEDYSDTVLGLKLFLEGACVDLGVQHAIVQCTRADELESHLVDCERHGTPLLLILDNVMDLPGGPYDL